MNLKARILSKTSVAALLACCAMATACQGTKSGDNNKNVRTRTQEAEAMLATLKALPEQGAFMFGHHDDPMYGIGWVGDEQRSDIQSVCGDWPAVMSFDLGHLELGHNKNLDGVAFDRMRRETVAQYERGGMVSFSWHADNPLTGKDAWDVSDSTAVRSVLPGGDNHDKFMGWLDRVADFLNSIKTADGVKVPVLFRPWHEHTGSWFWWGQALCTDEEYDALWQMTYKRMREKGATQLLWAYSPGIEPKDTTEYLRRWPGDSIIDLIGVDCYQYECRTDYLENLDRSLRIMTAVGKAHDKAIALTETGYESVPDSKWWTGTLLPAIAGYPISYVLVWRNAHDKPGHFYGPYPGHASEKDFQAFYDDPRTLFIKDMKKMSEEKKDK